MHNINSAIGQEHAARIIAARDRAASDQAWQIRKGEILRSEIPLFFAAMAEELKSAAATFNGAIGVGGIEASSTDLEIVIRAQARNFFVRRITRKMNGETATLVTEKVIGYRKSTHRSELLFDVRSDGTVLLDGRNYFQAADEFFRDAADFCAE